LRPECSDLSRQPGNWEGRSKFSTWAFIRIRREILDLGRSWQPFVRLKVGRGDDDEEDGVLQWRPPLEGWRKLPVTADQLKAAYAKVAGSPLLGAAIQTLSKRERRIVKAHFASQRGPNKSIAHLARQYRRSYWKTTLIIGGAVLKLQQACREPERKVA
jgi:hypothetical protein